MNIIKAELVVGVDIDQTLVSWTEPTINGPEKVTFNFADKEVYLTPHTYHIDLVKMYKKRGYYVIAWSANGWEHCLQAIQKLGLEEYVDHVQTKLTKHMDDNPNSSDILGPRVYCEDLTKPITSYPYIQQYLQYRP